MAPSIAAAAFAGLIVALMYLGRDRENPPSPAIWLAVTWVFLGASRMLSQWLHSGIALAGTPDQYLEGSPMDRLLLSAIEVAALLVLAYRSRRISRFIRENKIILLFFAYCLISILWSDFPLVTLKRWTKALGNISMVLLVLTDRNTFSAIKQFFTRTGVLLIAISVLVIKDYPEYGRGYNGWTWTTFYCGVSTDKNGLGVICLIFGLAVLWQFVEVYRNKRTRNRKQLLLVHGTVLSMTIWLLHMANSSTALGCFALGGVLLLIATHSGTPRTVHMLATLIILGGVVTYAFPETYESLVRMLGRKPDLTGRTDIWVDVLQIRFNHILGTGFESFWLGPRADFFWHKYYFHPNEAHNGYIETYLNLGWVGVTLLAAQFVVGYQNIVSAFRRKMPTATLRFALLAVATLYNMTEAAFKVMHPMWIAFLFAVIWVPDFQIRRKLRPAVSSQECIRTVAEMDMAKLDLMAT
jgi:exopolysaccharide production protein ExoQ